MASREEILADFQACTGIEDVSVAICQLEDAGWVLVDAVNKALPSRPVSGASATTATSASTQVGAGSSPSSPQPPSPSARTDSLSQMETAESPPNPFAAFRNPLPLRQTTSGAARATISDDLYAGPSSSYGPRTRMLEFVVHHLDRTFPLKIVDNVDVKTLKTQIQAETGFPPCQQSLRGFKGSSSLAPTDSRLLSELNLPKENVLHLVTPDIDPAISASSNGEEESTKESASDFKLVVTNVTNNESYTLNFRPTKTVLGVKLDVSHLTDIPLSKQSWSGWPKSANGDLTLAQLGIPQEHHLTVDRILSPPARSMPLLEDGEGSSRAGASTSRRRDTETSSPSVHVVDSSDDFEDATSEVMMDDEDFFDRPGKEGGASAGQTFNPLIPDDYGDEALASIKFSEEFSSRYGSPHPNFFPGTLEDAIRESCLKPPKDRKMLAIYLHHDSSVLANVFCTQALCAESVASFLDENFVTFGWDMSFHSNKQRAIQMITQHFGNLAASTIKNLDIDRFPLLALVYKLRGTTEIFQIIHGNLTLDELMSQLLSASETYHAQLSVEIAEGREREARDAVKREQDLAFEMAQKADREKEAQRRREEEQRLAQEKADADRKALEEALRLKEEKEKEKRRREIERRLPPEPPLESRHAKIRFRMMCGQRNLERRFLPEDTLQIIFDFLASEGFPTDEYKVLGSWPRRDLTTLDPSKTLEELKLFPQETLTLEEK